MAQDQQTDSNVLAVLRAARGKKRFFGWGSVSVALLVLLLGWWLWPQEDGIRWQTQPVDRGDMVLTATATGNLQPNSEITVGAEISGLIRDVLVEENDQVSKGQVLARFDTAELEVALAQAEARLALARASVAEAEATVEEAGLAQQRIVRLIEQNLSSESELDTAKAAQKRAEARLAYARASVREAEAAVSQSRTRLDKAVIRAPITGVVLQRSVEPGNTIAASFQAPQLFLLAEDLTQMALHISLDEADVAQVKAGQRAVFSVDAWPNREFNASVSSVYLYPTTENNVVTYTTVLTVDNSDGLLLPGMTATATITTGERNQVLRVPNTALRFTPPQESNGGMLSHPASRRPGEASGPGNTVWRLVDGAPQRLVLRTGESDGQYTEVLSDNLAEGDMVITGILNSGAGK